MERPSDLIKKLIDDGDDVNEVEGAGNTPLFCAAYDGWNEGVELLCELGEKVNASNNVRGSRRVGRLPSPSWFCFGFFFSSRVRKNAPRTAHHRPLRYSRRMNATHIVIARRPGTPRGSGRRT